MWLVWQPNLYIWMPFHSYTFTISSCLPSFCVTSFLTCCSHLDLSLPLGRSTFTFILRTFFGILCSSLYIKRLGMFPFQFSLPLRDGSTLHKWSAPSASSQYYIKHSHGSQFSCFGVAKQQQRVTWNIYVTFHELNSMDLIQCVNVSKWNLSISEHNTVYKSFKRSKNGWTMWNNCEKP
jgi:hypothetical protein